MGRSKNLPAADKPIQEKRQKKGGRRFSIPLGRQLVVLLAVAVIAAVLISVYLGYVSARAELHQEVDEFLMERSEEFLGIQRGTDPSTALQSGNMDFVPEGFLNLWREAQDLFDYQASLLLRNDSWMQLLIHDRTTDEKTRLPLGGYGFWPLPAEEIDWEICLGNRSATYTTRKVAVTKPASIQSGENEGSASDADAEIPSFVPITGPEGNPDGWTGRESDPQSANQDARGAPTTALLVPDDSDFVVAAVDFSDDSSAVQETLNLRVYTVPIGNGVALQIGRDLSEVDTALGDLRDRVIQVGALTAIGAALLGWIVGRRLVQPVKQLADKTDTITESLDLTTPVDVKGSREVVLLASSFNKMLATLNQSREQQKQLIADASHELRTPLTSLRTNIEMLAQDIITDPEEREAVLEDAQAEIVEFAKIVDELMELNREAHRADESVVLCLGSVAEEAADRARRQSHRKIEVIADGPREVLCHEIGLKRAVGNLLSNAVKFSPDGSPIEVKVTGTQLEVRDYGDGINPDHSEKIFDRFYREVEARSTAGSGLGLSIVRQIVEHHGGEVWAKNHPEGGAVVGFSLPPSNGQL